MACEQKLPNGRKSKLYPELVNYYGDEEKALHKYAEIFTDRFKKSFGDWERNKFKDTYWGGEPTLEALLGLNYSKNPLPKEQVDTIRKINRVSDSIQGPFEEGARYRKGKTELTGVTNWLQSKGPRVFGVTELNFDEKSLKELMFNTEFVKFTTANPNASDELIADKKKEIQDNIDKTFEFFPKIANAGTDVHKLQEEVLKGKKLKDLNSEDFPLIKDLSAAYQRAIDIKNLIETKYLNQSIHFIVEAQLYNESAGLAGTSDLIVVKENGHVDIYDYKTSKKEFDKWSNSKETSVKYQLAFYKQMLRAYGLTVDNVYYVPMNLSLDENGNIDDFEHVALVEVDNIGPNSEIVSHINRIIPVNEIVEEVTTEDNGVVLDFLKTAFNYEPPKKVSSITDAMIDEVIEKHRKRGSIYNPYTKEKERNISLSDPNVRDKVRKYLKLKINAENNLSSDLYSTIESIRTAYNNRSNITARNFKWAGSKLEDRYAAIRKYVDDYELVSVGDKIVKSYKWEKLNIPEAEALGLLLMINKDTGVIDIINTTTKDLGEINELNFGKSLVSNFIASKNKEKELNPIAATNGNIEMMKVIGFIINNPDIFNENVRVGSVSSLSTFNNNPHGGIVQNLFSQFSSVLNLSDSALKDKVKQVSADNLFEKSQIKDIIDFYDMLMTDTLSANSKFEYRVGSADYFSRKEFYKEIKELLDSEYAYAHNVLQMLYNRVDKLMREKAFEPSQMETPEGYIKRRELEILVSIINDMKQRRVHQETDLTLFGENGHLMSDNKILTQPDEMRKASVRAVIEIQNSKNTRIRQRFVDFINTSRKFYKSLFAEKLSKAEQLAGGKSKLYRNLFEYGTDVEGNSFNTFRLRDPNEVTGRYDYNKHNQQPLTKSEREFIKMFINEVSKVRGRRGTTDIASRDVPLMKASAPTKFLKLIDNVSTKGFTSALKEAIDETVNPLSALNSDRAEYEEKLSAMNDIFDPFASTDASQEKRLKTLSEVDSLELETDLEIILSSFVLSNIKTEENSQVLNELNAIRASVAIADMKLFKSFPEILDYIEMLMREDLYGQTMKSKEQARVATRTEPLKAVASTISIGLSPTTALVNFMTNMWQTNSAIMGIGSDRLSFSSFMKAGTFVFKEVLSGKTIDNINFVDHLNQEFGIYDMEKSRLIQTLKEDKQGVKNFERWLHFMNSYPDYMMRVTLFLGEAIEDGVVDVSNGKISNKSSLYWDDKNQRIQYDVTKDKRFSLLFKQGVHKNSDEYLRQKSLYESIKKDLQNEYKKVKGDTILTPYADKDIRSKIKFANQVYQESTTENKTMLERFAYGSLLAMFKRWLLAKKNLYFRNYVPEEENLIAGRRFTYYDEESGEYKTVWRGRAMEGIFQSLYFTFKELARTKSLLETKQSLSDYQIRNLRHLLSDMSQFAAISLLYGIAASDDDEEKKRLEQKFLKYLFYSAKDLNILNTWNSLTMQNNSLFAVSYVNTIIGDLVSDLYDGVFKEDYSPKTLRNIGLTRSAVEFYEFVDLE